jgi:GPI transamidase subunit PIG-U
VNEQVSPGKPAARVLALYFFLLAIFRSRVRLLVATVRTIVRHPLFKLTIIGLSIRLVLAPLTQFTYDPVVWYSAGNDMLAGLNPYYTKTYSYPPLWGYTYFPFLLMASLLADPRSFATHVSQMDWISLVVGYSPTILSPALLLAVKLPLIIGDLATGFLLFKLVKGYSGFGTARKAYVFWLFNPFVIWTSSVHGAFDVLPAMFTLLALAFLVRSKYLLSGMSMSIAILYKLYPIYLLPLYAILVWTNLGRDRSLRANLSQGLQRLSVFVVGGLVPILAFLPFVSIPDMLHAVSIRQAYLSSMGGLSPWMLNYLPGFGWMWGLATGNLLAIELITALFAFAVSTLAGWMLVRRGPADIEGLFRTHIVGISAIYLTLVTVNPQYIIWIIPFLTLTAFTSGLYRKRGMILSALALSWQLTISGPLVLLPLIHLGLPADLLTASVQSVLVSFRVSFNPVLLICGTAGGLLLISFLFGKAGLRGIGTLTFPSMLTHPQITFRGLRKSVLTAYTYVLVGFIIAISLSALFIQSSTTERFLPTSLKSTLNGTTLTTQDSFSITAGNFPLQINLVAVPIASVQKDRPVFIYYDPMFPAFGNEQRGWIGVLDHLPAELSLRGYAGEINTVNATQLRQVMTENLTSIIVIPSGVFPSTVQNATGGLVGRWLRSGGTLVWMGGPFGLYSASLLVRDQTLLPFSAIESISADSQEEILGYGLDTLPINGTSRIAEVTTRFSSALNLTYSDVWTAPTVGLLNSIGGLAIGHVQNSSDASRSSISVVPVGLGRVILFGGPVTNLLTADGEDIIAHDTAQVLSLGDTLANGQIEFTTFTILAGASDNLNFRATFNVTSAVSGLALVAFSDYSFSRLFWRTVLPISALA